MNSVATKSGIKAAALAGLAVFVLSACEDPRRVSWSPDGNTAAVIAADGLRMSDESGNLGEPKPAVELVSWFPDNQRLLTVEYEKVETWQKLQDLETPEALHLAMDTAAKMLAQSKTHKGDWEKFGESVQKLPHTREAVIYLRERKDKEMTSIHGDQWGKVKTTVEVGVHRICCYDLAGKTLTGRKLIFSTMRDVKEIRVSPHGKAFLLVYRQEQDDDTPFTLAHVSIDTGKASTISSAVSIYPDWAPDGKAIYFIEADLPARALEGVDMKHVPLIGSLCSRATDPANDGLSGDASSKILARLLFLRNGRVRALADGAIAFSALPVQLPGSDNQIVRKQTLFVLRPNENALVAPLVSMDALDTGADLMEYFEVNRSGKLISIPSRKEGVTVYSVLTGAAVRVDGNGFNWMKRLTFVPTWRNNDELCLGMKPAKTEDDRSEVVLWSTTHDTARSLSTDWPASARKRFLE